MSREDWIAAELADDDDVLPMTLEQHITDQLYALEKMAVVVGMARVVGHDMGPAEWDLIGRADDPCLYAVCIRCSVGQASIYWDGHEWLMDLTECTMPCRMKEAA